MKKILLLLITLFVSGLTFGQLNTRDLIKGKINVQANRDAENINVFNINTSKGTYTNKDGEFLIAVDKGDKLLISGLQYQEFNVVITQNIIAEKFISISINERVNQLEEATVRANKLTGDIEVDASRVKIQDINVINQTGKEMTETFGYEFRPDDKSKVENDAMDRGYLKNGLNVANLFRLLLSTDKKEKVEAEEADVAVRKVYNDDFFQKNFAIDHEHINEFIFYAKENGLQAEMLKKGNELQLIQFLIAKSKTFKAQQE